MSSIVRTSVWLTPDLQLRRRTGAYPTSTVPNEMCLWLIGKVSVAENTREVDGEQSCAICLLSHNFFAVVHFQPHLQYQPRDKQETCQRIEMIVDFDWVAN